MTLMGATQTSLKKIMHQLPPPGRVEGLFLVGSQKTGEH